MGLYLSNHSKLSKRRHYLNQYGYVDNGAYHFFFFFFSISRTAELGQQMACADTPMDHVATIISTVANTSWLIGIWNRMIR